MTHIVNDVIEKYLKGLGENLTDKERIKKQFEKLGLNYHEELSKLQQDDVPRIIIKHNQFYMQCGESNAPLEHLEAIVMQEQLIRALDKQFSCYSIDGKPRVSNPVSKNCDNCTDDKCTMKIRLWLWAWDRPFVMALHPEMLTNWNQYKLKLLNSRLPMIAANTVFNLVEGNVIVDIGGTVSKESLATVVQARSELRGLMDEFNW